MGEYVVGQREREERAAKRKAEWEASRHGYLPTWTEDQRAEHDRIRADALKSKRVKSTFGVPDSTPPGPPLTHIDSSIQTAATQLNLSDGSLESESELAGEWLIARIRDFAPAANYTLSEWDEWILRHSVADIMQRIQDEARGSIIKAKELDRYYKKWMASTVNICVVLARRAMEFEKRNGLVETVVARPGMRVPVAWEDRYELIYESELPWVVSLVMQNAFLGNPLAGEKRPWRSR